jgi:hypothetical protein
VSMAPAGQELVVELVLLLVELVMLADSTR